MITSEEAFGIVMQNALKSNSEEVDLSNVTGRILDENIYADRDFPPFERVTMDGIAINSEGWESGLREFVVTHLQPAGGRQTRLDSIDSAIEVMTGAILPENADVVVRYEDITTSDSDVSKHASVHLDRVKPFQNVHRKGEDRREGDLVIAKGTLVLAPEVGVLASVGKQRIEVLAIPRVAIISTGDELVEVELVPEVHQLRKSNVLTIQSELKSLGVDSDTFHIIDSKEVIREKIQDIMKKYEVIILSGGVSKGKLDFVPEVLSSLGIEKIFHRVKQRPGKPFWFGRSEKNIVFALPGNPVSTFMCYHKYVAAWFIKSFGLKPEQPFATLTEDFHFNPDLTYFLQVKISLTTSGKIEATPVVGHGSGDLANLLFTDGFLELPAHKKSFEKGEAYSLILFRNGIALS